MVVGNSVAVLTDLAPGASVTVDLPTGTGSADQRVADRILGDLFFGGGPFGGSPDDQRLLVRQAILNQLTFDQNTGMSTPLATDGAVLLAFGRGDVVGVPGSRGRRRPRPATCCTSCRLPIAIQGKVTFTGDLMQGTTVSSDGGQVGGKGGGGGGPPMIFFQGGTVTQAYRPPAFDGALSTSRLILAINQNTVGAPGGALIEPSGPGDVPLTDQEQTQTSIDGAPAVELFDRSAGTWMRLAHFSGAVPVSVAEPGRYVDPTSGTVLVRFRSGDQNGVGFSFQVQLEGTVQ